MPQQYEEKSRDFNSELGMAMFPDQKIVLDKIEQ
jgi:hypothetical protein